jgi:hypothetical protein
MGEGEGGEKDGLTLTLRTSSHRISIRSSMSLTKGPLTRTVPRGPQFQRRPRTLGIFRIRVFVETVSDRQ